MADGKERLIKTEEGELRNVEESDSQTEVVGSYYTLPTMRFTNIVQFVLVCDLVSSLALWLTGGGDKYMESNVTNFDIWDSVFDLALLASLRVGILFVSYHYLESITLRGIDNPDNPNLSTKKYIMHTIGILLSVCSLAYSITKGVLVYRVLGEKQHKMHVSYYALVISSISFSFIETLFALASFSSMKRLKVFGVLHKKGEKQKKKKVNLRRLMTLAIPVSIIMISVPTPLVSQLIAVHYSLPNFYILDLQKHF